MQERITVAPDLIGIHHHGKQLEAHGPSNCTGALAITRGPVFARASNHGWRGTTHILSRQSSAMWSSPRRPSQLQTSDRPEADRETQHRDEQRVVAYTDGACSGNPGPGGWAWAVAGGRFATGAEPHTTNQRMEVTAAYQAVIAHEGPIEVVSDSTYVVNCFKQRWWEGWLKRGWTNSQRKPVANRDLWEPFIELVRARGNVTFRWVKGHSEDRMNQLVDQLAVEASQSQAGRRGRCP